MKGRQMRGTLQVVDDCTFEVTGLEIAPGQTVLVYGATESSEASENLQTAFPISMVELAGDSFGVTARGALLDSVTWDAIGTVVFVENGTLAVSGLVLLDANANEQPTTMFENCKTLGDNIRVRWTIDELNGSIDIGLEGRILQGDQLSFGPAVPVSGNCAGSEHIYDLRLKGDVTIHTPCIVKMACVCGNFVGHALH
eukprot:6744839-Pyramimonas_sp.AAC.1